MQSEAVELLRRGSVIAGVRAKTPGGVLEVRADLTIGADGRDSVVRKLSGLEVQELGAPIDVLWMRISRREADPDVPLGRIDRGRVLVLIYRGDYWQCGLVIPKGGAAQIRARGLPALHDELSNLAPFPGDRVAEIASFDNIRLLTVKVDRLSRWYRAGLLCIGDAAHALSPIGGVGINLAIQDAVAAANLLARPLGEHRLGVSDLRRVEQRRSLPTRLTQALQIAVQERVIRPALESRERVRAPLAVRLFERFPLLRRLPARWIGLGFRPEHVR